MVMKKHDEYFVGDACFEKARREFLIKTAAFGQKRHYRFHYYSQIAIIGRIQSELSPVKASLIWSRKMLATKPPFLLRTR